MDEERNFGEELERRLEVLEAPDYEDPARGDLPTVDVIIVGIVVLITVVGMYWWGY